VRISPLKEVAAKLGIKVWKVYLAQKNGATLLKREIRKLEAMA
jgi:hypothetical protein